MRAGPRAQAHCERPLSWVSLLGARRRRARPGEHRRWPAVGARARERYGGPASERAANPSIGTGIGCLEPGECGAPWLWPLPLSLADPAVLGGTWERPRGEGGRRPGSGSRSWARALAERPCVTVPAALTAARPAEGRVGVGSAGVIAIGNAGPGEARRGGAARRGGGAGSGAGDCGAPRQRGGEEASAEPAPRPGASGRAGGGGGQRRVLGLRQEGAGGACRNPDGGWKGPSREFTSYSPSRSGWLGGRGAGVETDGCSLQMS